MFERFTDRARRVVVLAQEEARQLGHNYIGTEHLLLGLIREGEGVGAKALESVGVSLEEARQEVQSIIGKVSGEMPAGHIPFTPRAKTVLELALREALQLGHNYIGTEHVVLGLVREGTGVAAQVLERLGTAPGRLRSSVVNILAGHATPGPPGPPPGTRLDTGRFSPGLLAALEAAVGRASGRPAVGTQHLLSVLAEWDDLAAHAALRAGGFDPERLEVPIAEWDVAGTRDETPDEWGQRVTDIDTDDETVVVRFVDPVLRLRVSRAIEAGAADDVKAAFGRVVHDLEARLPREQEGPEDAGAESEGE